MKNQIEIIETEKGFKTKGLNKEIAINLHLPAKLAYDILFLVNKKIENKDIKINDYERNTTTCPFFLKDNGIDFLIIFPDTYIRFPWEENCQELYMHQL